MRSPGAFCAAGQPAAAGTSPVSSRSCPAISAALPALHTRSSHLRVHAVSSPPAPQSRPPHAGSQHTA
eukprot:5774321-Prymnesium_polylepis.1